MSAIGVLLATVVSAASPEKGLVFMGDETPQFAVSAVPADGASWTVTDWRGETRAEGRIAADGTLEVKGLPPGYWTLAVGDAAALGFTTVIDPATRRKVAESSYAADSAFSWMCIPYAYRKDFKVGLSEHLARLIQAAGISQTRERFCWEDVQKEKDGPINWGRYLENEKLLLSKGIRTSWYNHNSPKFVGGKGGGWGRQSRARDLVAVRDFCERVGRDFGSTLADFEYFNEPDLGHPAWDVTAQYKAASVGFRAAKSGVPTTNFSMCLGVDFNYDNLVFDNDMAKYIDIFNIHNYSQLQDYDAFNARIHAFLEKRGIGDYPILITESGCVNEGEATLPTDVDRCKAHTPEQEMIVADFIPKAQIKRQFGGVWRNHFFIFASFHERGGRKDWGIIRRDGTARPGLAAFAALTAELDGFRILGRAEAGPGVEAYLYDRGDGQKTLAFWGKGGCGVSVACEGPARLVDWCGTPRQVRPEDGFIALTADEHVSYLTGDIDVKIVKEATSAGTPRLHEPPEGEDLEVVIRADFPGSDFDVVDGFTAVETKKGGEGRVNVEIWNLSETPKTGRLYSKNGTLVGWPEDEIELPARGVFAKEVTLKPQVGKDGEAKWMLRGIFGGKKTTRFAVPVRDFASGLRTLKKVTAQTTDPKAWTKNNSALTTAFKAEGDAMRIDMSWVTDDPKVKTSDRWAYNQIEVPKAAQNGLKYVVFEIKSVQDKVENNFQCANVYTYGKNRGDRIVCNKPMKEWTKVHVSIPEKKDAPVESVGIGANPVGKELTFWVRNVEFYCSEVEK